MSEDLTDEEKEIIAQHRAKTVKHGKVRVYGQHDGGEHEFELDDDRADRVIDRHKALWSDDEPEADAKPGKSKSKPKDDEDGGTIYGRRIRRVS